MGKKADKFRKDSRKDSTSAATGLSAPPKISGCPIPDPIDCSLGKPINNPNDGILMKCSNQQCPFDGQPVHEQCFALYEDHLIKKIATMGSARGWTEQQRRANLWEKKGQSLIAKTCRCRCGHGTTRRDEMVHFEKTLQEQAAARAAEAAKRKHNKVQKNLPQLNFPLQRGPPPNPKEKRRGRHNDSVCSDTSLDEAYTYHRDPVVFGTEYHRANSIISTAPTFADFEDTLSTCSRNEVFSEPPQTADLVPAPVPPPITRSYAAAIKNKDEKLLELFSPTLSILDDSGLESKGASPLFSIPDSKHGSHSSSGSETSDEVVEMTPVRPVHSQISVRDRKPKISQPSSSEKIAAEISKRITKIQSLQEQINREFSLEHIPHWSPMSGRGFNLGEALIANTIFPGLLNPY